MYNKYFSVSCSFKIQDDEEHPARLNSALPTDVKLMYYYVIRF